MKETTRNHYFVMWKLVGLVTFLGYQIASGQDTMMAKAWHGLYMALFLVVSISIELIMTQKVKKVAVVLEGILLGVGVFLFPVTALLFGLLFLEDTCATYQLPPWTYFVGFVVLIPYVALKQELIVGILGISGIALLYMQEKTIIEQYRSAIGLEEETQMELKTDIERQNENHQREMKRSHLKFENQMLEDRNRISQALHDKLGHSINGSIYQLEAAKLLVQKKPEECERILKIVIEQLRGSMDEIRAILRQERPDKKRMALLALQSLCEECESNYHIATHLTIEDREGTIPEKLWEIILDNTYEAVTNALKYANCHNIYIDIIAMNEVVRCTIRDDGKGAENVEDGMGLTGMKNRVRAVKGFIGIESELGFAINMILPL